ncbi:NlpC/P60 family protein [Streptomyces sp. NPDC060028]|uniref:C40 family peptidase n=1 Tax=Streptomyces sp. NPDC060028 TaxID=3347041 RepID=UPI0036C7CB49
MKGWKKMGCLGLLLLVAAACCTAPVLLSTAAGQAAAGQRGPVSAAATGIPQRMLAAYITGATQVTAHVSDCTGMRWQILAGIARVESNHASGHMVDPSGDITPVIVGPRLDGSGAGGNTTAIRDTDGGHWDGDTEFERAVGPFQFLPATFRTYGKDGNGDGTVSPHNADDAAASAAVYLCGNGRDLNNREKLRAAIHTYNASWAYVDDVLSGIDRYDALGAVPAAPSGNAAAVISAALAQQGIPYSWGGGGPSGPTTGICCSPGGQDGRTVTGFDCSGLTQYAYAQARITLPRTAAAQASAGQRIPAAAGLGALQPGDLVFYGYNPTADTTIHHVGIYLGDGKMINAPRPGKPVRVDPVTAMPDYAGGARLL